MGPLCWPEGILGVLSWPGTGWASQRSGPPPRLQQAIPKKGLPGKFLGGRVRPSRPNVRCWVQRTPLGVQQFAWARG